MAELRVPGVSVWLLVDGEEDGFQLGVTSVDNPLPVDEETVFQAGSITKTLTAAAAVRLAQAGKLDLDAPVRRYLPELRLADETAAAAITMRDLLSHGGGFVGDWFEDFGWGDDAVSRYVDGVARLPQLTPLRAVWSYNNAGFAIAGRVLEVVAALPTRSRRGPRPAGRTVLSLGGDAAPLRSWPCHRRRPGTNRRAMACPA